MAILPCPCVDLHGRNKEGGYIMELWDRRMNLRASWQNDIWDHCTDFCKAFYEALLLLRSFLQGLFYFHTNYWIEILENLPILYCARKRQTTGGVL